MTTEKTCLLCGGDDLELETADYVRCPACLTISQRSPSERAKRETAPETYEHGVSQVDHRWLRLISEQFDQLSKDRSMLDLGCGNGAFIGLAAEQGWRVTGVEESEYLAARGEEAGLDIERKSLEQWAQGQGGSYDVVRLWYVLEHVNRPGEILRAAVNTLKPGGLLVIAVPNEAGWLSRLVMKSEDDRYWEHPLHIHHYPPFGLERHIESLGCETVLAEASRPTDLMRNANLPLNETWEQAREKVPELCRIFYQLGVGRGREIIFRKNN